jgi:hypothetical protein
MRTVEAIKHLFGLGPRAQEFQSLATSGLDQFSRKAKNVSTVLKVG